MLTFVLPFLLKYKNGLGKVDSGRVLGTVILWNDNVLNCLISTIEIISGKKEGQPTLSMQSREDKNSFFEGGGMF